MSQKLFMLLLGCKPRGRNTEQHDIFFGIATSLKELKPAIENFWPEAEGKIHIDSWREVNFVDGYEISIEERTEELRQQPLRLSFSTSAAIKKTTWKSIIIN